MMSRPERAGANTSPSQTRVSWLYPAPDTHRNLCRKRDVIRSNLPLPHDAREKIKKDIYQQADDRLSIFV